MDIEAADFKKLRQLQWKIMENVAASALIPLMQIGDDLGLFIHLYKTGPASAEEFSKSAGIDGRYGREWLLALSAAGYVTFTSEDDKFSLSAEQAAVFVENDGPALMIGAYNLLAGTIYNTEKIKSVFTSGAGVDWGRFHPCVFQGTAKFFKPSYAVNLVEKWIPNVHGLNEKLTNGASFADVGCGHGISTLMIAEAFPASKVVGFDIHQPSINEAKKLAKKSQLKNVEFVTASAKSYQGEFDVIGFFDCLHDLGDPVGAAKYANKKLRGGGTIMLIEPSASDNPEDNFNTIGQMYYCFSTMACIPASKSQEIGLALGAQAGPAKLFEILKESGFAEIKIAQQNASNMVIEATKP